MIVKKVFKYLLILMASNFFFYHLNQYLINNGLLIDERWGEDLSINNMFDFIKYFYILIVFAPFFEELSCRLFINRTNRNIIIGVSFLICIVLYKISKFFIIFYFEFYYESLVIIIFIIFIWLGVNFIIKDKLLNFINNIDQKKLLIFSSLIFGLLHFGTNFSSQSSLILLIPVLKHVVSGLIYGVFRIKYGFLNGVILHSVNNSLAFIAIVT